MGGWGECDSVEEEERGWEEVDWCGVVVMCWFCFFFFWSMWVADWMTSWLGCSIGLFLREVGCVFERESVVFVPVG